MSGMKPQAKKYRALINLVYSDLIEGKEGTPLCNKGEITELYPELVALPERVQLLIDKGFIEEVPDVKIVRPTKSEESTEEKK